MSSDFRREIKDGFTIAAIDQQLQVIVNGAWSENVERCLVEGQIVNLKLIKHLGWRGMDFSFLGRLPFLKSLTIIDSQILDLSPIEGISSLEHLNLQVSNKAKLDFSKLKDLRHIYIDWIPCAEALFQSKSIERFAVSHMPESLLPNLTGVKRLINLSIFDSRFESLNGLSVLHNLKRLRLVNLNKLCTIEGLCGLTSLKELTVQQCKGFQDISVLGDLHSLKYLALQSVGPLQSLAPLNRHPSLEWISWSGSTRIEDGKVSALLTIPNLKCAYFVDKRGYDIKEAVFPKSYNYNFENF